MFLKDQAVGRFLVNGLVATGVHYGVLSLLIEVAGMKSAGLANGAAALFGIAASYLGSRYFVFGSGETVAHTLPRFLLVYGAVACLHAAVLAVWTDAWRLPYGPGFLIAMGGSMALTFLANRFFVFAGPKDSIDRTPVEGR
jgi:putative flippase GtrA